MLSVICYLENYIFLVSNTRILKYSLHGRTFEESLPEQDIGHPYEVRLKEKDMLFLEPEANKVLTYDIFTKNLRLFAGNGNNKLTDEPCLDASFRQPCSWTVEFDNVTNVTDAMSASLTMIAVKTIYKNNKCVVTKTRDQK